jgi:hypothetical protein
MKKLIALAFLVQLGIAYGCADRKSIDENSPSVFYVDSKNGNDNNPGNLEKPFQTLDKALEVVAERVNYGIRSDKIYLREGRYKKTSATTLYRLELKGTQDDYAELSAMPAEPGAPGAVQRKSGLWYENVVFDDGYVIETPWEKVPGEGNIWKTNPQYTLLEWIHQNIWPWVRSEKGFPITDNDDTPETTSFTVAPYMLLQDREPTVWVDYVDSIAGPGTRTYNHETGELFVWPIDNKDPNSCLWESWYGGPEDYEIGTLHLDGEGRALFDGNMEYAAIRGFEFYCFNKIFEFHRRKYESESERVIQRNVLMEDNRFSYGWIHILLDGNTVNQKQDSLILPRYHDRFAWTARNNVFYRPSRECFQLHGDNHVFEFNEIIERLGPWAGPAGCVSAVNTRNTRNALIRNNLIYRHGTGKLGRGSVFMIEVGSGSHADTTGTYVFGGQTYENNLFVDVYNPVMILGKGGTRMRDITVRNNIFMNVKNDAAIRISSPHENLVIESNIFYDQDYAIEIPGFDNFVEGYRSLPSSISIRNNIFSNSKNVIDPDLLIPGENSNLNITDNLFHQNEQPSVGERVVEKNPMFRSHEQWDFRPQSSGSEKTNYRYFGPYPPDGSFSPGMDWWNFNSNKGF